MPPQTKFTTQRSTYIDPADGTTKRTPKISSKLIKLNEQNAPALYNLGTFCLQDKKFNLAIELLNKSIKLYDSKEARLNLATCYKLQNNTSKAKSIIESIIKDYPEFPLAYNNLGLMQYDTQDIEASLTNYRRALTLKPNYADARWNYSLALNLQYFTDIELGRNPPVQNFQLAMEYFEARFEKSNPVTVAIHDGRRWQGEPLQPGEQIMLLCEQGFGDMAQFFRYAYNFKPEQVVLHLPIEMHFMVRPGYQCTNNTLGSTCKYWIPMMSVSKYFPITDTPYIDTPQATAPNELLTDNFKIGIVWKGNPSHDNDRNRSRDLKDFEWIKNYGKIFSLQKDNKLKNNWMTQLKIGHWASTVGMINALDIVITVDTSVAHLCGAMGKPVIVLIPEIGIDWRWGELGVKSVWYSNMRLARKQSMEEVKRFLEEFKSNGNKFLEIVKPKQDVDLTLATSIVQKVQENIELEAA